MLENKVPPYVLQENKLTLRGQFGEVYVGDRCIDWSNQSEFIWAKFSSFLKAIETALDVIDESSIDGAHHSVSTLRLCADLMTSIDQKYISLIDSMGIKRVEKFFGKLNKNKVSQCISVLKEARDITAPHANKEKHSEVVRTCASYLPKHGQSRHPFIVQCFHVISHRDYAIDTSIIEQGGAGLSLTQYMKEQVYWALAADDAYKKIILSAGKPEKDFDQRKISVTAIKALQNAPMLTIFPYDRRTKQVEISESRAHLRQATHVQCREGYSVRMSIDSPKRGSSFQFGPTQWDVDKALLKRAKNSK